VVVAIEDTATLYWSPDGRSDPPTETETSRKFRLPRCYLFTVLNSSLLFSHGRPSEQLLSSRNINELAASFFDCDPRMCRLYESIYAGERRRPGRPNDDDAVGLFDVGLSRCGTRHRATESASHRAHRRLGSFLSRRLGRTTTSQQQSDGIRIASQSRRQSTDQYVNTKP